MKKKIQKQELQLSEPESTIVSYKPDKHSIIQENIELYFMIDKEIKAYADENHIDITQEQIEYIRKQIMQSYNMLNTMGNYAVIIGQIFGNLFKNRL